MGTGLLGSVGVEIQGEQGQEKGQGCVWWEGCGNGGLGGGARARSPTRA